MSNEDLRLLTPIKFIQDLRDALYPHLKVHKSYVLECEECSEMYPNTLDYCGECGRPYDD